MDNITKNFTWDEVTDSNTAEQLGIDNSIPTYMEDNVIRLAEGVLQPLRDSLGVPLIVTSWYRNPKLNKIVGGVINSAHLYGGAVDIKSPSVSPTVIYREIKGMDTMGLFKEEIDYCRLYKSFVHVNIWVPNRGINKARGIFV